MAHKNLAQAGHADIAEANVDVKDFASKVRRFLLSEEGPTAIEYALMLALIVIVAMAGLRVTGIMMRANFGRVGTSLK